MISTSRRALGLCVVGMLAASPLRAEVYLVGLDFLQARTVYSDPYNTETLRPFNITGSSDAFAANGALTGWSELATDQAITMAVEDIFRQIPTGNPNTTSSIRIFDGRVPSTLAGRRLDLAVGSGAVLSGEYGYSGQDAAFDPASYANDSSAGIIYLNNIATLNVVYSQASQVINAIAGTAAHEIGHILGLQHVSVGTVQPYPIMATSSTGLTDAERLTVRRFESTPGTQAGGQSSVSALLANLGTSATSDFNQDGKVDLNDASVLLSHWGQQSSLLQNGDANNDHLVNLDDASILLSQWGMGPTPPPALSAWPQEAAAYLQAAAVPEPSISLLLCVVGLFASSRVRVRARRRESGC